MLLTGSLSFLVTFMYYDFPIYREALMPKIVDHDDRRADIARATGRVLVKKGIEALTLRDIAREAKFSPGILAHYFRDRTEIVSHALDYFSEASLQRQLQSLSTAENLEDAVVRELPIEDSVRDEWTTRFQVWARSAISPKWAEAQARLLEEQRVSASRMLPKRGYGSTKAEAGLLADQLMALAIGLCICNYFDPATFDAAKVRNIVRKAMGRPRAARRRAKPSL